jgi:tetratricopeptide (TPR) repeat protein
MRALDDVPLPTRALVAIQSTTGYLGKTLMPSELRALYGYPREVSLLTWQVALPLLALALLAVAAVGLRHRLKVLPAALAAYLAMLLPVLGIVQVGPQAMAERYTYLPGVAFALLVGASLGNLWERAPHALRRLVTAGSLALVLGLSWLSIRQIGVWRDSESLWTQVLAYEPGSTEAHNSRADYYYKRGRYHDALADYTAALASLPAVGPTHALKRRAAFWNDRAVTFVMLGRLPEAIDDQNQAIRLQPTRPDYYLNRARMLRLQGRLDEAMSDLRQARALQDQTK